MMATERRSRRDGLVLAMTVGLALAHSAWSADWGLLDGRVSGSWLGYAQSEQAGALPRRGYVLRLLPQLEGPQAACCWRTRPSAQTAPRTELSVPLVATQDEAPAEASPQHQRIQPLANLDSAALRAPFIGLWTDAPVRIRPLGSQQLALLWPGNGPVLRLRYCLSAEGLLIDALDLQAQIRTRWYLPLDYAIDAGLLSCRD